MFSFFLFSFFLIEAGAKTIRHTGCGGSRVLSIDVNPCETEPCMWKKREVAHMTAVVISSVDSKGGNLTVTVDLDGLEVEYPGIEPDICKKVQCPIRKGRIYNMTYDVYIEEFFPEVSHSFFSYVRLNVSFHSYSDGNNHEMGRRGFRRRGCDSVCISSRWHQTVDRSSRCFLSYHYLRMR